MSAYVEFEWDSRDLQLWRGGKVDDALARALRLAGNQALRSMQFDSKSYIQRRKNLREQVIVDGLPLVFPGRKAATIGMSWTMYVSGDPMPVSAFPYIQTRTGVSVRINRGAGTKRIKGAFAARMNSGHLGVFRRDGRFGRRGNPKLERIQELWTSRISDTMRDASVIPTVHAAAYARMQKTFTKGLARELRKLARSGDE